MNCTPKVLCSTFGVQFIKRLLILIFNNLADISPN